MTADPRLVAFVVRAALAVCMLLTGLCLLLTAGTGPVAVSAEAASGPGSLAELRQAAPSPAEDCPLALAYPESVRRWCTLILEAAAAHDLPANLIAAVILQESGGQAAIISPSGAVGLMQVMPRDGLAAEFQCPNGPCFASRPTILELQDPAYNLEYGTRLLAGLLQRHGDLRLALKAYGPLDVEFAYADAVLAIFENYR